MSSEKLSSKATGRYSVHKALPYWYIGCLSSELRQKPIQVRIWDTPLVLFRDKQGVARALLDRCSHRNVPLSKGDCIEGHIQCPYHGWQFDGDGQCVLIPALCSPVQGNARNVPCFPVKEQQGYIWVYTDSKAPPNHEPYVFPHKDDPEYTSIMYQADFEGSVHATAENILDVPHTAFLHKGLFRGGEANRIQTVIRRYNDRAECEYIGEPRPSGLLGRLLAPNGGEVKHVDRFILPSIAQVEYALENRELMTTSALTPISDFHTRMYAVVTVKVKLWTALLRPIVTPIALKVVQQDVVMLKHQVESIREFGGERYVYTEADVLGASISRLLNRASTEHIPVLEKGEPEGQAQAIIKGNLLA